MQLQSIPPRAHDINQCVEHANGCAKGYASAQLTKMDGSIKDISDGEVQDIVLQGAHRYTAESWLANTKRLVQCLRILCTPTNVVIDVKKSVVKHGKIEYQTVKRRGTNGNYCYRDFS